jgi:hypothetical protein
MLLPENFSVREGPLRVESGQATDVETTSPSVPSKQAAHHRAGWKCLVNSMLGADVHTTAEESVVVDI